MTDKGRKETMEITIKLTKENWLRGDWPDPGGDDSRETFALSGSEKVNGARCCLGHYLSALGVSDEAMAGCALPSEVRTRTAENWLRYPTAAYWLIAPPLTGKPIGLQQIELSNVNDDADMCDATRVAKLTEIFSKHGVTLIWEG